MMFFNKKTKKLECANCTKELEEKFIFCPYCGKQSKSKQDIQKDYGLIGATDEPILQNPMAAAGILGGMLAPMMQGIVESLMQRADSPEITQMPNGISIKMNAKPQKKPKEKTLKANLSDEQAKRMINLPRHQAKTKVRRLADKVIYDIDAPGIEAIEDILVSKLENGYEIKAISKNKVYTNSIPINLPLVQYSFNEKGISMEFALQEFN